MREVRGEKLAIVGQRKWISATVAARRDEEKGEEKEAGDTGHGRRFCPVSEGG